MAHEHLHDLPPPRSTTAVVIAALAKLDNEPFASPEDRAKRLAALLSLEGFQILPAISMPRAIR